MAEQKITLPMLELDLQKVTTFVSRPFRLMQGDKGYIQPFHLSVGFAPYSATADTLCFAGTKPDGQVIEVEAEPSRFSKDGDTWFFYLPDEVAQAIGTFEAYFYVKKGNSIVASTTKFAYEVGAKFGDDEASNSYVSVFNSLRDKFNQIIESSRTELNNWTSLNNQARADLDKLLKDLKTQTDNWLSAKSSEIQGIITNYNSKYNELVGKWNNQITTQQSDYAAQKAKIDSEYKQQLENLKAQLNSEWQTQKQAQQASFDSFKADLTNRISQAKSDIDSIQTKIPELQSRLDAINSKVRDVDFNSFVKSVQGVKPDVNGNVNLPNQNVAFSFDSSTGEPAMRMTSYLNYWPVDQAAIKDVLKNQLPSKYATKDELASAGKVKTVNSQQPDANGNISIDINSSIDSAIKKIHWKYEEVSGQTSTSFKTLDITPTVDSSGNYVINGSGPAWTARNLIDLRNNISTQNSNYQSRFTTLESRCTALESQLTALQSQLNNLLSVISVSDGSLTVTGNLIIRKGNVQNYWGGTDQYVAYSPSGVRRGHFGVYDNGTFHVND